MIFNIRCQFRYSHIFDTTWCQQTTTKTRLYDQTKLHKSYLFIKTVKKIKTIISLTILNIVQNYCFDTELVQLIKHHDPFNVMWFHTITLLSKVLYYGQYARCSIIMSTVLLLCMVINVYGEYFNDVILYSNACTIQAINNHQRHYWLLLCY